jgi:ADP-ribosylglycohydrolase
MLTCLQRIEGCLRGIAIGDAIGKQSEGLTADRVRYWYPHGIRGFEGPVGTVIPRYAGNTKHEWRVAETTDDTERTLAVAHALIEDGGISHTGVGRWLLRCTKCVHPGIRSLWEFHRAGDPARLATCHEGCGGAIRVAPVGMFLKPHRPDELVTAAYEASISTHAGPMALAAAAANAAAVSTAVEGGSADEIFADAERAAVIAETRWRDTTRPGFADALRLVREDLLAAGNLTADDISRKWFPKQPLTIVPLAIALGTVTTSPDQAILLAANIGGDSDSVASIAGGILGARQPELVNDTWAVVVEQVNQLDLTSLAAELAPFRH